MYFEEHVAFVGSHVEEWVAAEECGDDFDGTGHGDEEARGWHADDGTEDVWHAEARAVAEMLEVGTKEVARARVGIFGNGSKGFHGRRDENKSMITMCE